MDFGAFLANTVAELDIGSFSDVDLKLIPVAFVVPNFMAIRTDREQSAQLFDFTQGLLEILDVLVTFLLRPFSFPYPFVYLPNA